MKRLPVFVSETTQRVLRHLHPDLKRILRRAMDELAKNSRKGKPLQRELSGLWSLPVARYRIIYQIETTRILIIYVGPRRTVYELLREFLTQESPE